MRHFGIALLVFVCGLFCTGWIETSRLIKVNKDGSGVIYVRVMFNPDYLDEGQKVHNEEELKAAVYGKGVRYVISQEVKKDARGWTGYLAKYHFTDVSDLRIFPASLPRAMTAERGDPIRDGGWRFRLTEVKRVITEEEAAEEKKKKKKGAPSGKLMMLEILPLILEVPAADGDDDDDDDDADLVEDAKEDLQLKMQQRGRRYVTYLQVNGEIDAEKSNAPYVSKKKPNTVVLNDEQFDVIWNYGPLARKEIAEEEPFFGALGKDADVEGWRTVSTHVKLYFR